MLVHLPVFVGVAVAMAVLCLAVALYRILKPAGELEGRLEESVSREVILSRPVQEKRRFAFLNTVKLDNRLAGSLAVELARADLALTVNEYVLIRFGGATLGIIVGSLAMRNLAVGLAAGLVVMQLPVLILHRRSRSRQRSFQNQLVDVITMLSSGLRAGIGLVQAMDLVRREMPAPSRDEFGRVVREVGLGVSLGDAMRSLADRMPGDDLMMLITVINIQAEVGGNLAAVLETVVTTIHERVRIMQEIRSLTAMGRATGYLLAGMPFLTGGLIFVINPTYMLPMFTLKWIWMPVIALVLIGIGFAIISKIIDIKV